MKYPGALAFAFLIFTTSTVSALQALSLPPNPAPSSPPKVVTVRGWIYRGCYTDNVDSRTLTAIKWTGNLTPRRCASTCRGYRYLALEHSNECYCGDTVARASIPTPDYSCENVCSGNQQSVCGGTNVLNLYEVDNVATPSLSLISSNSTNSSNSALLAPPAPQASATVAKVKGWTYRGCWTDDRYDRTLISKKFKGSITPEKCAQLCKGYQFFGLEYSNECYCGNTISHATQRAPENACSTICMGDFKTICGGSNSIGLYEVGEEPEISAS